MTVVARHLTITGRVQGVFYRGWMVRTTLVLGLVGWVRNRLNGDVEALVQGEQADVERLIQLAWQGPSAAQVDNIVDEHVEVDDFSDFEQRSSV